MFKRTDYCAHNYGVSYLRIPNRTVHLKILKVEKVSVIFSKIF